MTHYSAKILLSRTPEPPQNPADQGRPEAAPGRQGRPAVRGPWLGERTECSRWLAAGRCCTGLKCPGVFNVGKGKAVAAEKAEEDLDRKRKREAAA